MKTYIQIKEDYLVNLVFAHAAAIVASKIPESGLIVRDELAGGEMGENYEIVWLIETPNNDFYIARRSDVDSDELRSYGDNEDAARVDFDSMRAYFEEVFSEETETE